MSMFVLGFKGFYLDLILYSLHSILYKVLWYTAVRSSSVCWMGLDIL